MKIKVPESKNLPCFIYHLLLFTFIEIIITDLDFSLDTIFKHFSVIWWLFYSLSYTQFTKSHLRHFSVKPARISISGKNLHAKFRKIMVSSLGPN